MVCETIPNNKSENLKYFKRMIERGHVSIRMQIVDMRHNINARILHVGVNSNKATTGNNFKEYH